MCTIATIRLDFPHTDEDHVISFLSNKKNLYYIYGKEISKISEKEHFHIVLKTEYHIDTLRRKVKKHFEFTKSH